MRFIKLFLLSMIFGVLLLFIFKDKLIDIYTKNEPIQLLQLKQENNLINSSNIITKDIYIKNFKYDFLKIKELKFKYSHSIGHNGSINIDKLEANGVEIDMDRVGQDSDSKSKLALFISTAKLKNVLLKLNNNIYNLDIELEKFSLCDKLDISKLIAQIDRKYATIKVDAKINSNKLDGSINILTNDIRLTGNIFIDKETLKIETKDIKLPISELKLNNINSKVIYNFKKNILDATLNFDAIYKDLSQDNILVHINSNNLNIYNIDILNKKIDINSTLDITKQTLSLSSFIDSKPLKISLQKNGALVNGKGFFVENFDFSFNTKDKELTLKSHISSLKNIALSQDFDATLDIDAKIDSDFNIKAKISMPWYRYKDIISSKKSKIDIDFIGFLNSKGATLNLANKNVNIKTKEIDILTDLNLLLIINKDSGIDITGDILLLDGIITYEPIKTSFYQDKDIIIIQDMQKNSTIKPDNKLSISLLINPEKDLKYKTKELDIDFKPQLSIQKGKNTNMEIYGITNIKKGSALFMDKEFEILPSEIHFIDKDYTNPYLNLNIKHIAKDYTQINIYITSRLDTPLFILSSNPQLSQNDIFSYLLFDASTSTIFNNTNSNTNLSATALGVGVKELFNKVGFFKIDTLNILNNKSGTLGYEIGTRVNKDMRIIYKDDDITSFIIQYSINRSLRVEVETKQVGQGIGIYYIKDFEW